MQNRVIFSICKRVLPLDFAGPLHVFYEAQSTFGIPYQILFVSNEPIQEFGGDFMITKLLNYSDVKVTNTDIIILPGFELSKFDSKQSKELFDWLRNAHQREAIICSICTGAFALAAAGILDHVTCTTHWKYINELQKRSPLSSVQKDRLFVQHGNIFTSAGVATGIDLALHLIQEKHGAELSFEIAREMVVYRRRNAAEPQHSVFMHYRQHTNNDIHYLQDWISENLHQNILLDNLATLIHTSSRNLTRTFKAVTGITIGEYIEKLRAEIAMQLMKQNNKVSFVTKKCGLKSTAQLRNILRKQYGSLPSSFKS
jgi:transcriptional regulator GlxA family with amidase domain